MPTHESVRPSPYEGNVQGGDVHGGDEISSPLLAERDALRALLERPLLTVASRLAFEGEFDRLTLRDELRAVCAAAKLRGVQAEQVLIAVKEIWAALPTARESAQNTSGNPILSQVVTMTLDEYYSL